MVTSPTAEPLENALAEAGTRGLPAPALGDHSTYRKLLGVGTPHSCASVRSDRSTPWSTVRSEASGNWHSVSGSAHGAGIHKGDEARESLRPW